ncbi:Protein of unknown function [Oceanospirillum multiglobuliferum]|nr:Protein of unknown function [Oceanospirillum multiglobuliferum]
MRYQIGISVGLAFALSACMNAPVQQQTDAPEQPIVETPAYAGGAMPDVPKSYTQLERSNLSISENAGADYPLGIKASKVSAKPSERFQVNSDGWIKDLKTGQTWMACAIGQVWAKGYCQGTALQFDLDSAQQVVQLSNQQQVFGFSNWRLPSIEELNTLVQCQSVVTELSCEKVSNVPTIAQESFTNTPASQFWSSTEAKDDQAFYYALTFRYGLVQKWHKNSQFALRLTRP